MDSSKAGAKGRKIEEDEAKDRGGPDEKRK